MNVILQYLSDLEANNNREWYHSNKEQHQEAHAEFERVIKQLIASIGQTDASIIYNVPKDLIFKLVRDTRFSNDKSPYNPKFRAHISSAGKLPIPCGYFLSIAPSNRSFLGGGLFTSMFKNATKMVRDYIVIHGKGFETIIKDKIFSSYYSVKGEALKNVPRGYDETHPQAEYLKNKSWYLEYPVSDSLLENRECFVEQATQIFLCMKPFNDYLNEALNNFVMPSR